MFNEVALSSSNTDSTIYVWDIRSGSTVFSFKQSKSAKGCLTTVAKQGAGLQIGTVLATQTDRAVINVYQWTRDQVQYKMTTPEKLVCITASNQGSLVAGATATGRVFIWQVSTGLLLKVFEAHYRQVTRMAFTGDDSALLTASEDASVHVWLVGQLLEHEADQGRPSPLYSWSDHTLPVTDIKVGAGSLTSARVYTASLDSTVKMWDLNTGEMLITFLYPKPVSSVAVDPSETKLFAACENVIYPTDLYRRRHESSYGGQVVEAAGSGGRVESIGIKETSTGIHQNKLTGPIFAGHSDVITSLDLSFDASLLVSGAEDGKCIVWDVASRQILRKFELHKGPVTHVSCMLRPPELDMGSSNTSDILPVPWRPFKRAIATEEEEERSDSLQSVLDTSRDMKKHQEMVEDGASYSSLPSALKPVKDVQVALSTLNAGNSTNALQAQISALESDLLRLHEHHNKIKTLHDDMYNTMVDRFMAKRRKKTSEQQ